LTDEALLELLVDPSTGEALAEASDSLQGSREFAVIDGIPRFVATHDTDQIQTGESFGFKWGQRDSYGSDRMEEWLRTWLLQRYGFATAADARTHFREAGCVLDAGCGSAMSAALLLAPGWSEGTARWVGADISSAIDIAKTRLATVERTYFVQADVLALPFRNETFGAIFSEGVLHHTMSTEHALKSLVPLLRPGGELMFYVYRRKSPVREFTDDHVRARISPLPPNEAWELLRPLTALGEALANLHAEIDVPEPIDVLGIPAGRYDVQRLVYWHFAKMFWRDEMTFEENLHVNFDWYHPRYAHRQTAAEVRRWCEEAGLVVKRFHEEESGFTVRATRA
jgi:SAM-dependent methyltransferase